jgi:hypothetical protein
MSRRLAPGALVALVGLLGAGLIAFSDKDDGKRAAAAGAVAFSHKAGLYDEPFSLVLSAEASAAEVFYTLDGSLPDRGRGVKYAAPIAVRGTTVVRAAALAAGESGATRVFTRSYLFPAQVARQPRRPPGYVARLFSQRQGRWQELDYEIDPRILEDPASGVLAAHLRALPTISLVLPTADFNFLYANHWQRGREWERATSVELIYPGAPPFADFSGFQADCGLRMQGGLAVDQARKKSFRLLFKKKYGAGWLEYPVFESAVHHAGSAAQRFDTLVLRAGGNENWSKDDAWKHAPSTYLRDQLARDTQIEMSALGARGLFVHLYLNGLYFGLYNLCERPDASFLSTYLGGAREDYTSVNHSGLVSGDMEPWGRLLAASATAPRDAAARRELLRAVDLTSFCDYILLNWCLGTGDWPYNNWYAGLRTEPAGGAVFLAWDAEFALWTNPGYLQSNPGAWVNPGFERGSSPLPRLWRALREDEAFRLHFADRAHRHCSPGGALSDAALRERFRRLAVSIEGAIVAESARWGDAARGNERTPRTRARDWYPSRDTLLGLLDGNAERFIAALRAAGLYPRLDAPELPPAESMRPGEPLVIGAPGAPAMVYYTCDGSDPRGPDGEPSPHALRYDAAAPPPLGAALRLKARARRGGEWSALADRLYLLDGALPLRFSELHHSPLEGKAHELIEIQNRSAAPIDAGGARLAGVSFHFPPETELGPWEVAVILPRDGAGLFRARHPEARVLGLYRGRLRRQGELRLIDRHGRLLDTVRWEPPGRNEERAPGVSLELLRDGTTGEERWTPSREPGGTPGRAPQR